MHPFSNRPPPDAMSYPPRVPAAAPSLEPMAMNAEATDHHPVAPSATLLRSRATFKAGSALVLAGVLIGSVLGVGVRVRRDVAHVAPPPSPVAAKAPAPPAPPPSYAGVPFGSLVVSPPPTAPPVAPAALAGPVATPSEPAPATTPAAAAKPQKTSAGSSKRSKATSKKVVEDDGYTLASATPDEPKPKRAAEKPEPKKVAEKPEPKPKPSRASSDDADRILKAATKAAENSL